MFHTTVSPILPAFPNLSTELAAQRLPAILSAVLFVGVSLLIGHILAKVIATQGMKCRPSVILSLTGMFSLAVFLRYGLSVTAVQGIFLFFVLLYASCSDLTDHTVDDHVWVTVLALSPAGIPTLGIASMMIGALCVFIPQMAMALLPPHKTLGEADIKLSTALAFLLGTRKGIGACLLGLLIAVIFISICNRVGHRCKKKPFALVPFLSVGALAVFLV